MPSIQYIQRQQIDTLKWDKCIDKAPNGLIYGYSFFLDHLARQWNGLVLGDYEAVMPVPWNRKYGIQYVYNPAFIQRLDIFGTHITESIATSFYDELFNRFRYVDADVKTFYARARCKSYTRPNFTIDLSQSYLQIQAGYSKECIINTRKAIQRGCVFSENISIPQIIELYRAAYGKFIPQFGDAGYEQLQKLCEQALAIRRLKPCGITDRESGKVIFGGLIFHCPHRVYYAIAAPTEKGRQSRAAYYFIDHLLQHFSEKPLLFDFGGSDIPNVADFYNRFGPATETYHRIHYNQLPWWVKLFKR